MKHIQKIIVIALFSLLSIFQASAEEITIDTIDVLDTHTVSFSLSDTTIFWDNDIQGDIKILKDTTIENATRDTEDNQTVLINLPAPLKKDTTYSLLGLFGAEGSIDFVTTGELSGVEIQNDGFALEEQTIDFIRIIDQDTIAVVYTTDVLSSVFEYKLLTELKINAISRKNATDGRINMELRDEIERESEFIFIVVSLFDSEENEITFDNSIYDFTSPAILEESSWIPSILGESEDEFMKQLALEEKIAARNEAKKQESQEEDIIDESLEIELSAASVQYNLEKVATTAQEMPDTGAESWLLILVTLFINSFLYFARRKNFA